MLSALNTKVRLVRCPQCRQLLPELPDFQVYRCGGCGATLKARGLDSLPMLGNGSHDDNSDYDDQHYRQLALMIPTLVTLMSRGPSGSNPPGSVAIDIGLQVENNYPHHRTRVTSVELTFMLVGFNLEMLSAGFNQFSSASKPLYALISLLLANAAVLTCILELIHNGIKDKDASPNRPVFGTLPDIFGLGLAVIQCACSAVQYYFLHQHASNPMKLSPLPLFFFTCLVVFKLKGN